MPEQTNHGLHIVEIEITNACNLSCTHCYVQKDKTIFMSMQQVKSLIDQCSELGVYRMVFTGGEPLLHKDLFALAAYAKEHNIPEIVLFTNGLLITESNANSLSVFHHVQISIDVPPGEKGHFRMEYGKELEKRVKLLVAKHIPVYLHATLHRSLLDFISPLIEYAHGLGVRIGFNKLSPMNRKELQHECLQPDELKRALTIIASFMHKEGYNVGCSDPLLFLVDENRMAYFASLKGKGIKGGCTAGIAALYITASGEVYPCPFLTLSAGNVFKTSLRNIWYNSSLLEKLRNRSSYEGRCGQCQFVDCCGGCRVSSFSRTGSITGSDEDCFLEVHS